VSQTINTVQYTHTDNSIFYNIYWPDMTCFVTWFIFFILNSILVFLH